MPDDKDNQAGREEHSIGRPLVSYRGAMWAYAVLAGLCILTLHGDPLYLALLIIGALAIKTWIVEARKRIE